MIYKKAILSAFIAGFAGFILGYDMGISGGTINFVQEYFHLDSSGKGFALSVYIFGAVVGSIFTHVLNNKLGRKKTLLFGALIMLIGGIGVYTLSFDYTLFLIFRSIAGFGMGLLFSSVPSYVTEISPPKIRGALGSILQLTTGIGIMAGYYFTYVMINNHPSKSDVSNLWINIYGSEVFFIVLYFVALLYILESPIWLLMYNKVSKAKDIITKLWPDENVEEYISSHNSLYSSKDQPSEIKQELRKSGKYKLLLFIAFFMAALNQLCGINPIIYYAPNIFDTILHSGTDHSFIYSVINGLFFTLGSLVAMFTIDKFGRKALLFIGVSVMSVSLCLIGFHIYTNNYSMLLIYLVYLFIFAYNFSSGSMRFLYLGELTPSPIRTSILGFAGVVNWIADFLVSWTLPIMAASVFLNVHFHNAAVYFLYAIFGFIFLALVFTLPETKGKSLHELAKYWQIKDEN